MRISGKIRDVGIDWITAVAMSQTARESVEDLAVSLWRKETERGNDIVPWRFAGYEGWRCGPIQLGHRADSACVRLTSYVAQSHWRPLYVNAERVTRVDLQVTMEPERGVQQTLGVVHRAALRKAQKSKAGTLVTLIRSNDGGGTVYLGSRKSEVFGRVYAKGPESHREDMEHAVRFEVELKGAPCVSVLRSVHASALEVAAIAGYVCGFMEGRACSLVLPSVDSHYISSSRPRSDDERRLRWLESQVRPCVQLLISHGCYTNVCEALGLSEQGQ